MEPVRINFLGRMTLLASGLPAILGLFAMGVVLPSIARDFQAVPHAVLLSQLVGAVAGFSFAVGSPFMGGLIGRFGFRTVYFWSTLVFALSGLSVMLLDNLYVILLTRVVLGVAVAGAVVASVTGISTLPDKQRAQLFGMQTMVGGGLGLLSYIVVAKLAAFGWRTPFALHALGLLLLPFILMLPKVDAAAGLHGHHGHGASSAAPRTLAKGGIVVAGGLTIPLLLLAFYMGMTGLIPPLFSPFYLNSIGVLDPTMIALPLMAAALVAVIAAGFYGKLQGRFGINGMFAATLLLIALGAALSGMTSTLAQFAIAQMVMSAGLAWTIANLNAATVLIAPPHLTSRAIAIINGIYYGSQAALPFIASGLRQVAGAGGVFEGYAAVGLVAGLVYLVVALSERRHPRVSLEEAADAIGDAAVRQASA